MLLPRKDRNCSHHLLLSPPSFLPSKRIPFLSFFSRVKILVPKEREGIGETIRGCTARREWLKGGLKRWAVHRGSSSSSFVSSRFGGIPRVACETRRGRLRPRGSAEESERWLWRRKEERERERERANEIG